MFGTPMTACARRCATLLEQREQIAAGAACGRMETRLDQPADADGPGHGRRPLAARRQARRVSGRIA